MSLNTMKTYDTGLAAFTKFLQIQGINEMWPPKLETVVHFLAYLSLKALSANTARSYISAISYKCKVSGFPDIAQNFIIQKMLEGMKRLKTRSDTRLPITPAILENIVSVLPGICANIYEQKLFKAAFTLAFAGLLRVGEITYSKGRDLSKILSKNDVLLTRDGKSLIVKLRFSKTDQTGKGVTLEIPKSESALCPIKSINEYLSVRSVADGPFFCHFSGAPLTRYQFSAILSKSLKHSGSDTNRFKAHSFRIGGATTLSMSGYTIDEIKKMGRWKSSAYKSYIRTPSILFSKTAFSGK